MLYPKRHVLCWINTVHHWATVKHSAQWRPQVSLLPQLPRAPFLWHFQPWQQSCLGLVACQVQVPRASSRAGRPAIPPATPPARCLARSGSTVGSSGLAGGVSAGGASGLAGGASGLAGGASGSAGGASGSAGGASASSGAGRGSGGAELGSAGGAPASGGAGPGASGAGPGSAGAGHCWGEKSGGLVIKTAAVAAAAATAVGVVLAPGEEKIVGITSPLPLSLIFGTMPKPHVRLTLEQI